MLNSSRPSTLGERLAVLWPLVVRTLLSVDGLRSKMPSGTRHSRVPWVEPFSVLHNPDTTALNRATTYNRPPAPPAAD